MKILSIRGVRNVTATALFIILTKCVYNIILTRRIAEVLAYKVHDEDVGPFSTIRPFVIAVYPRPIAGTSLTFLLLGPSAPPLLSRTLITLYLISTLSLRTFSFEPHRAAWMLLSVQMFRPDNSNQSIFLTDC